MLDDKIIIKRMRIKGHYFIVARDRRDGRFLAYEKWSSNAKKREKAKKMVILKARQKLREKELDKFRTVMVDYVIRKTYKAKKRKGKGDTDARNIEYEIYFTLVLDYTLYKVQNRKRRFYEDCKYEIEDIIIEKFEEQIFNYFAINFNESLAEAVLDFDFGITDEDYRTEEFEEVKYMLISANVSKDYNFESYCIKALDDVKLEVEDLYKAWKNEIMRKLGRREEL